VTPAVMIVVVDYGGGNLSSVVKAIAAAGGAPRVGTEPRDLAGAQAIVIPGVGHFDVTAGLDGMRPAIRARVSAGVPLLGICLGMQWLFEGSVEAPERSGLGALPGFCTRLTARAGVKVPHVGWNTIESTGVRSRLLASVPNGASAYFTHSYVAPDGTATVARTSHGMPFASVVERGGVCGTQFHPEKSGGVGLSILASFVNIAREASRC